MFSFQFSDYDYWPRGTKEAEAFNVNQHVFANTQNIDKADVGRDSVCILSGIFFQSTLYLGTYGYNSVFSYWYVTSPTEKRALRSQVYSF